MKSLISIAIFLLNSSAEARIPHDNKNLDILNSIPIEIGYEEKSKYEDKIAHELDLIFKKIAEESIDNDRLLNRGTHAKGLCFNGEMKVYSKNELKNIFKYDSYKIEKLKQSIFKGDNKYDLEVRFANGKGQKNPDTANDVRAIAFSVLTNGQFTNVSGTDRFDFMMNSSPMFAVNNITEFYELMKAARVFQGDLSYLINPLYFKRVLKAKSLLDQYERNDSKSYATEEYWGNVPYVLGRTLTDAPSQIAKFKVTPCDGLKRQSEPSNGKAANYLASDIKKRVSNGEVCFFLKVQEFNQAKLRAHYQNSEQKNWSTAEWIENGGELWPEEILPYYTIARITIKGQESLVDLNECNKRSINTRLNSNHELLPIGSLARVRTYVEEKSRERRMNAN